MDFQPKVFGVLDDMDRLLAKFANIEVGTPDLIPDVLKLICRTRVLVHRLSEGLEHLYTQETDVGNREKAVTVKEKIIEQYKSERAERMEWAAAVQNSIDQLRTEFGARMSLKQADAQNVLESKLIKETERCWKIQGTTDQLGRDNIYLKVENTAIKAENEVLITRIDIIEAQKVVLNQTVVMNEESIEELAIQRDTIADWAQSLESQKDSLKLAVDTSKIDKQTLSRENEAAAKNVASMRADLHTQKIGSLSSNHRMDASWDDVLNPMEQMISKISPGSKSAADLRKALLTIMKICVMVPNAPETLAKYLLSSEALSMGRRCLHNIAATWSVELFRYNNTCSCWTIDVDYCVLITTKRGRDQVQGLFELTLID